MAPPDPDLDAQRARTKPIDDAEVALVRSVVSEAEWLSEPDEAALRYALGLARLGQVRAPGGADVDLAPLLAPWHEEVTARLVPPLLARGGPDRGEVLRLLHDAAVHARAWRARVIEAHGERLPPGALDREICERALVLVAGGGGGVAWSYVGAFELLEQYGLAPRLLAGTSMGAVLMLFRARRARWNPEDFEAALGSLTVKTLFRFLQTGSRWGLPAALRLYLRAAIGEFLKGPDGHPLTLGQLVVPMIVTVTGIRNGALPRDPSYYEHLLDAEARSGPFAARRYATAIFRAVGELMVQRDRLARIYLGADEETRAFDAIDAVGFSSALPGVIHYDVLRDDERMHRLLGDLFARHDLFRLVDGGLVDNLPARAAWGAVQRGTIGTRNAFVLALEGFGPKLGQPLWYGLEQLAAQNVARSLPFVHHRRSFQRVLSPAEVVPSAAALGRAVRDGKSELHPDMPFVARMCRPFRPPAGG
ncbi:MAG: patatin-like phospholipase family protein [Anaeromyxobacteraceae bacterium]